MMKSKKVFKMVVVMTMVLTMMFGTTVSAKENVEADLAETAEINANSITEIPNGCTYLGTATQNNPLEGYLPFTASGQVQIYFYCPNNNRKDLVQGTITATPMSGGVVETFSFMNYYNEISVIDLSNLKGDGLYRIKYSIYVYGNGSVDVYMMIG